LEYATKQGADLHICPKSAPFVRLGGKNGVLQPVQGFDDWVLDLGTVKTVISELLTPEQRSELLKHKYTDVSYTHSELGRFRVSVYTQRGTHAVTIHTLPFDVPDFYKLNIHGDIACYMERDVLNDIGLIIVAGDYFSDKSVILAALVDLINQERDYHITTVENPIKYLHRHKNSIVTQKEIGIDVSDFETALKQIRQENPDVVMLSELRQEDIISVAELAEERLVLTSLRTNGNHEASKIFQAVKEIINAEAKKSGRNKIFLPNPYMSVIYQKERGTEGLICEIQMGELFGEELKANNGESDGRADTGSA
jgi:twitching motility protein PilT